jgi:hypothetical protein
MLAISMKAIQPIRSRQTFICRTVLNMVFLASFSKVWCTINTVSTGMSGHGGATWMAAGRALVKWNDFLNHGVSLCLVYDPIIPYPELM